MMTAYPVAWTATTTNPAIGNGTQTGAYYRLGRWVYFYISITFGSTTTAGSGAYSFSLPVPADTSGTVVAEALLLDSGTNYRTCLVQLNSANEIRVYQDANAAAGISHASPIVWATGDSIRIAGRYLAADAAATMTAYAAAWTATVTNPTIGNGVQSAQYARVGRWVYFRVQITFGSTTTAGSGTYSFSLPVEADVSNNLVGEAVLFDSGTNTRIGLAQLNGVDKCNVFQDGHTSTGISATSPITWATGDSIRISGRYLAAEGK